MFKKSPEKLWAEALAHESLGDRLRQAASTAGPPATRRSNIAPAMHAYSDCADALFKIPETERPSGWLDFATRLKAKHAELQRLSRELFPNAGA